MRLVLICRQQIIKTHAARYLKNKHHFKSIRMSDGITRIHKIFYYKDIKYARIPWVTRMVWYDGLYKLDNNIFVNWVAYKLENTAPDRDIVVSDVRYSHELYRLKKEFGFKVVRITMPVDPTKQIKPGNALGKNFSAGAVLLRELYGNFDDIGVDYSIYSENYQELTKAFTELVDKERSNLL
jgi:hypothetical protein